MELLPKLHQQLLFELLIAHLQLSLQIEHALLESRNARLLCVAEQWRSAIRDLRLSRGRRQLGWLGVQSLIGRLHLSCHHLLRISHLHADWESTRTSHGGPTQLDAKDISHTSGDLLVFAHQGRVRVGAKLQLVKVAFQVLQYVISAFELCHILGRRRCLLAPLKQIPQLHDLRVSHLDFALQLCNPVHQRSHLLRVSHHRDLARRYVVLLLGQIDTLRLLDS